MVYGLGTFFSVAPAVGAAEIVIYGFENGVEGWVVPEWAKASHDYVGKEASVSHDYAEEGSSSLELQVDFPGGRWTGAYIEHEVEVQDWTPFGWLVVSVYLPADAPTGLKGRLILTRGESQWTEMNRAIALTPGSWTAISVNFKPGSMNWKFFPDEEFRKAVQKIGVRIESDQQPVYSGSVYLDNMRLTE